MIDASNDPNAGLVGYSLTIEGQEWIVVGSSPACGPNYVVLENEDERTIIRPAGIVRRHRELELLAQS